MVAAVITPELGSELLVNDRSLAQDKVCACSFSLSTINCSEGVHN